MRSMAMASLVMLGLGSGWMDIRHAFLRLHASQTESSVRPHGNVWDYMMWGSGEWE